MKKLLIIILLASNIHSFCQTQIPDDSVKITIENNRPDSIISYGDTFLKDTRYNYSYNDLLKLQPTYLKRYLLLFNKIKTPLTQTVSSHCYTNNIGSIDLRFALGIYFQDKVIFIGFSNSNFMTINNRVYLLNLKVLHAIHDEIFDKGIKKSLRKLAKDFNEDFGW
ncbi:MAG: hypothetical protein C0592_13085 [Marinilabiliales bacterium]|nr:MAG: hypothetical protein C0592_13085 [Marinilabiliales bacterium]